MSPFMFSLIVIFAIVVLLVLSSCIKVVPQAKAFVVEI